MKWTIIYVKSFQVTVQFPSLKHGFEAHASSDSTPSKTVFGSKDTLPSNFGIFSGFNGKNSTAIFKDPLLIYE